MNAPFALDVPAVWQDAAAAALAVQGVVLVVGGPDSGKSTLCRHLLQSARDQGRSVAFIDADLGQSHLGPPTTIGLNFYPPHPPDDFGLQPDRLYFIGQTSPSGRMLETVVGLRGLVAAARRRCRLILVNTSGFISGPAAVRLKTAKAEVLRPRLGLVLVRGNETASLLPPLTLLCQETRLLPVSHQARLKSWEERRRYREERFAAFFAKARPQRFPLAGRCWLDFPWAQGLEITTAEKQELQELAETVIWRAERSGGFVYLVTAAPLPEAAQSLLAARLSPERLVWTAWPNLEFRLVGLLDKDMLTLSLGILLDMAWHQEELTLLTPLPDQKLPAVRFLRLGKLRLTPSGQELPPL